jgi:hypothetical protein
MTDTTWLHGYLGDAYAETTPEQRDRIIRAAEAIEQRWPDPDLEDTRREALATAVAVVLGDDTLEQVADAWHAARAAEQDARARLTGALLASDGPEVTLARRAQTTRMTVRKALGKR